MGVKDWITYVPLLCCFSVSINASRLAKNFLAAGPSRLTSKPMLPIPFERANDWEDQTADAILGKWRFMG